MTHAAQPSSASAPSAPSAGSALPATDATGAALPGQQATLYRVEQGAAWITLNRPENRNALSAVLVNELAAHFDAAQADPQARCIVITGNGPAFCAGADLKNPPGSATEGKTSVSLAEILARMQDSPKPVIIAVNGAAFAGGLGLVGAGDIVIAVDDAPFSFSEVRIGVIPAVISVVCVPKLGTHHAMKLFITGERFSGRQAVEFGLAHRAVTADQLRAAVQEEIDMIRTGGPIAVAECKRLVRRVQQLPRDEGFEEMSVWSRKMFVSPEGQEGMAAFREKRKPSWMQGD
ncbi:MAG: enoyl-CoA hydratase/isomerase family protein [Burkholderiales bacterium]|jgi:methylglutaconyl-CoA hydratase